MRQLPRRTHAAVLLRSLAIQGSWNYRTLIGGGFAYALLPVLRELYRSEPERLDAAVRKHGELFNSHPYLSPLALGAVASMEAEGEDPEVIERFKAAVRGSLGSFGDRLVWAGWRPVCLLLALVLLLSGAPWWLGVAAFLLVYNAGHVFLRVWGFRQGLMEGRRVGERLRHSSLSDTHALLSRFGAFLVGITLPMAVLGGLVRATLPWPWVLVSVLAVVLGVRLAFAVRTPALLLLAAIAVVGLVWGWIP